jgi:hypothetical protein
MDFARGSTRNIPVAGDDTIHDTSGRQRVMMKMKNTTKATMIEEKEPSSYHHNKENSQGRKNYIIIIYGPAFTTSKQILYQQCSWRTKNTLSLYTFV